MVGKTYLHDIISGVIKEVSKTDGGTTSNRRIDCGIEKSHSNDAVVITGLLPDTTSIYEYKIQPLRKKRKCKIDKTLEIVQGDRVLYTPRGKTSIKCYVTAILKSGKLKGYYKLTSVEDKQRHGPVSVRSLTKLETDRGLRIS